MTTSTLIPAPVPTPAAIALAPFLAVAGAITRMLRYVILIPALIVAAVRHQRRVMDPASVWQADDALFTQEGTLDLSVVIPFYNPGSSVGTTVHDLLRELDTAHVDFEIIAVSDGSTDGSEQYIQAIADPRVRLIVQPQNGGKGSALIRGFCEARGRYIGFIDADGDIAPKHVVDYLREIRNGGDIVYASKRHSASSSFSSPLRKIVSMGFIGLTKVMFRLDVDDTQTGCKVLRREVLGDVLPLLCEQRFALDLELFVVARRRGHVDYRPAAVHLGERLAGSTVTTKAVARTLRDVVTIWSRLRFSQAYPTPTRMAPVMALEPVLVREPVAA